MAGFYQSLTPIEGIKPKAYYLDDVRNLIRESLQGTFDEWLSMRGEIEILKDRQIIYKQDLEEFFEGL